MKFASDTHITHLGRVWLYVFCALAMIFLLLPTMLVIPMSFSDTSYLTFPPETWSWRWYHAYLNSFEWRSSTLTSLKVAILTVSLATPLGAAAAYGLRMSGGRLANAILLALAAPLLIPSMFIAIGVFYLYVRLNLLYSIGGLVIAHTALALPFVLALVATALRGVDENLERAARSLGASRMRAIFTVTLPQIRLSVVSAALLAFLTSFDEVIVALLVSGGYNETLTRRMFTSLRDQIDPTIAAISSILILLTVSLVLLSRMLEKNVEKP